MLNRVAKPILVSRDVCKRRRLHKNGNPLRHISFFSRGFCFRGVRRLCLDFHPSPHATPHFHAAYPFHYTPVPPLQEYFFSLWVLLLILEVGLLFSGITVGWSKRQQRSFPSNRVALDGDTRPTAHGNIEDTIEQTRIRSRLHLDWAKNPRKNLRIRSDLKNGFDGTAITWQTVCVSNTMDEPNEVALGESGWVRYGDNARGVSLCHYFWPAAKPKGVVVLVHGHGAHIGFDFLKVMENGEQHEYKDSFVEKANHDGFSVMGIDFQGHGRSNNLRNIRCYVERFQDYVDDLLDFVTCVQQDVELKKFHGLPMVLLGLSLGGCIAVNAIHQRGDLFKGTVLLAPMLSLEKVSKTGLNPYLRPLASLLSTLTPILCVAELKKNLKFPELQASYDNDPLCFHHNTRARVATEYLKATERTVKIMPQMTFPFLVIHSKEDDMTDYEGSAQLMDLAKSTDKTFKEAENMWHFLLKEPGNEKVMQQVLEWVHQHV